MGLMQDHLLNSGPEPQPHLQSPSAVSDTICTGSGDEGKDFQRGERPHYLTPASSVTAERATAWDGALRTRFNCYWDSRLPSEGAGRRLMEKFICRNLGRDS